MLNQNTGFYVYLVECKDGSYYCGYTPDLKKRMEQHKNAKASKYTSSKGFKRLVYYELHPDKSAAMKREIEIKKSGRIYKENLVREFNGNKIRI